jgi:RPA family protein
MISRQTAKKVRISDIMNGKWVKKEGMEPSYVTTPHGENVSRARILGTVVAKFKSEDGNFGSATIDDGTDTMRIKAFKDLKPLEPAEFGALVDIVGKVREYNDEIYIMPEIIRKIDDPNWELLRKLEIIVKLRGLEKAKQLIEKLKKDFPNTKDLKNHLMEKHKIESEWIDLALNKEAEAEEDSRSLLKKEILDILEKNPEGIRYNSLAKKIDAKESETEAAVNDLLSEGLCYEPTPGKIKKI